MKLKMNKACDLSSISVLPPNSRRSSLIAQQRSQSSQQSFSQGFSSQQNGMFSQISQSSLDEVLTENQRFSSQDKDNAIKRVSNLAPMSYPRDESQMPKSSVSVTRRWNSAPVPDHKFQVSEELEHRIGMIETSLSRFGMVLDSVQADVMQVNKGTKQVSLDVEGLRQKAIAHDDSLHQLNRGLEEMRAILDAGLRSVNDQLSKATQQDKLEQIQSQIVSLREQMDSNMQKRNLELSECFSGDLQAISCSLKTLHEKNTALAILPPKVTGADSSTQKCPLSREAEPRKVSIQAPLDPKIETGNWTTVKAEKVASKITSANSCKNLKQKRASPMVLLNKYYSENAEQKLVVDLDDDESDGDVSCLMLGNNFNKINGGFMDEINEETARILKAARRRKRKQSSRRPMPTCRKL